MKVSISFDGKARSMKVVEAFDGNQLVYRSEFSFHAKIAELVRTWRRQGCRVIVAKSYDPLTPSKTTKGTKT